MDVNADEMPWCVEISFTTELINLAWGPVSAALGLEGVTPIKYPYYHKLFDLRPKISFIIQAVVVDYIFKTSGSKRKYGFSIRKKRSINSPE